MPSADIHTLIEAVQGVRVLAVGDLMIDHFVHGVVSRVSPEAPIPVLARTGESRMLGGAGNVARNIAALGGRATLVALRGDDEAGDEASALLEREAMVEDGLVVAVARRTTTKTRFISGGQQLLRVDDEAIAPASLEGEERLIAKIRSLAAGQDAILLSDYGKGAVTPAVSEACVAAARATNVPLVVDSKARDLSRYGRADVVKPNAAELAHATGLPTETDEEVEIAIASALKTVDCRALVVTRAGKGLSVGERGAPVRHLRGRPAAVFDASGAGDTALAALGLALGAGRSLSEAAELALCASSIAVQKAGTAVVSPEEVLTADRQAGSVDRAATIAALDSAVDLVAGWRRAGYSVGFTNGCFDILHGGHIACLDQARAWCDRLVVGVNSDRSVRALKGEGRPVHDLQSRVGVLAALRCIDLIIPFDEETPLALIKALRPDVLIKGADYSGREVVGREIVEAHGGCVRLADYVEGHSTTATVQRLAGRT